MKKALIGIVISIALTSNVWAASYTPEGKVVQGCTKQAVMFNVWDGVYLLNATLAAAAMGFADINPMVTLGTSAAGFIAWGAVRTNHYRPRAFKDTNAQNKMLDSLTPVPGSVEDVLS